MRSLNPSSFRHAALAVSCAAALGFVSACSANPGPPPIVEEETETETATTTETPGANGDAASTGTERTEIEVGAEPLRNGLNPHLLADDTSAVRDIADLTLPSAFHGGEMDTDVLASAELIPVDTSADPEAETATTSAAAPSASATEAQDYARPPAMVVRYEINPAAQWSDGSPITGADFVYLWRGMVSTPGTLDPAGYRAIREVRAGGTGAKRVDVVFDEPVEDWQSLFRHLLPSHLLDSNAIDFATALADTIPASAGRYMVDKVDRGAGLVRLNRNDRFWGEQPASIDFVNVTAVRSTEQVADRLRSGQLVFADHVPAETTLDTYSLVPGTQVRVVDGPRKLGVTMSTVSPILGDVEVRRQMRSLIDVDLIARIAAGRSRDLAAADPVAPLQGEPEGLRGAVDKHRALRIAADPRDGQAMPAARALVDVLKRNGIDAEAVAAEMTAIASKLPAGDIDAVVGWSRGTDRAEWASKIQCPESEEYFAGNLSGLCTPGTDEIARQIVGGAVSLEEGEQLVTRELNREAVWIPLLSERRVAVLGSGITGSSPNLDEWTRGLAAAGQWRIDTSKEQQ